MDRIDGVMFWDEYCGMILETVGGRVGCEKEELNQTDASSQVSITMPQSLCSSFFLMR